MQLTTRNRTLTFFHPISKAVSKIITLHFRTLEHLIEIRQNQLCQIILLNTTHYIG